MQLWQYGLLVTARLLYMFRTFPASNIRSTKTVVAGTGPCHAVSYKATYKQVLCHTSGDRILGCIRITGLILNYSCYG